MGFDRTEFRNVAPAGFAARRVPDNNWLDNLAIVRKLLESSREAVAT